MKTDVKAWAEELVVAIHTQHPLENHHRRVQGLLEGALSSAIIKGHAEAREATQIPEDQMLELVTDLSNEVIEELLTAIKAWPRWASAHEGLAILEEEVSELRSWVYTSQKGRIHGEMRKEAIQVAAMAMRFAIEVCTQDGVLR